MGYAWKIMKTLVLMIALLTGCATTLPWQDNRQDKRCDIGLNEVYFSVSKSEIDFINGLVAD